MPTRRLKHIVMLVAMLLSTTAIAARSIDQIPNVHVADRTKYVSDPDGYLSPAAIARADSLIAQIWRESSSEVVAVIVKDMDGLDIDSYATKLFEEWGIGKKDKSNGVLLLVSVDDRKGVIRTGYGAEGVLPDVVCGRILRDDMFPRFKDGDYDGGVLNAVAKINTILTDPEAAEELRSEYANDSEGDVAAEFFNIWIICGVVAFAIMLICIAIKYFRSRGLERHERYHQLKSMSLPCLMVTILFLGIPILGYLLLRLLMKNIRRSVPKCPNCEHKMRLIDEVHDNDFLTPAQDKEEQLDSVDYDVWHCDNCGENEIIPYINSAKAYGVCPNCGARTEVAQSNQVVQQPTTSREGIGEKTYYCKNCNNLRKHLYRIAKLAAPPVIISGGGRGFGGGGGISGGSFGGGFTGGGGASGGW